MSACLWLLLLAPLLLTSLLLVQQLLLHGSDLLYAWAYGWQSPALAWGLLLAFSFLKS